jgi:peptidoglycan hydrolase CwlO-like protein
MSYDTDADYLYTQDDIDKLEAELAEARAQIAAKDEQIERLNGLLERAITAGVTAARIAVGAPAQETE